MPTMMTTLRALVFAVALCCLSAVPAEARQASSERPLTNGDVVKLARAGFSEKTIISLIQTRPANFDLATDRLIELKRNRVNERIIRAMIARGSAYAVDDGAAWDDDAEFFEGMRLPGANDSARGGAPRASDPGEVNIFGSSGGSRSSVRSRGRGTGGGASDTETVGSATVRIIRPPAEAGGAPPKLERTPTLTNKGVVELVEAGFTEGTIIRRIEQSPVEFDLSPGELAELRKRRVSEQVIKAMRTAMGEDAEKSSSPE